MAPPDHYPFVRHLVWKLLHNDRETLKLFASNPFPDEPPRYVRAVLYRYRFARPGNPESKWWNRERIGVWLPASSVNDSQLINYLEERGW